MSDDRTTEERIESAKNEFTFKRLPIQYYPTWGMRPGTQMFTQQLSCIFINGGFGDYITWLQPIRWLASEAKWIKGTLVVPKYFREMAEYFLRPFPEWTFLDHSELRDRRDLDGVPFRGPVVLDQQALNATGAHLLTCGWVYFTNKEKAPEGWDSYPQFAQVDLDETLSRYIGGVPAPGRYAVLTTGVTTPSRHVPGKYWNYVIEHIRERGLTPVFLGKAVVETGNARNIHTEYDRETRFDLGLDLRDKTTLLEAAAIMSRAAVVIGHDNGLLHLAGCTAAPIVFGYNLASPEHREPRRPAGRTYNVTLTHAELACNHCQSNMNFILGYNFRQCLYGDLACIHKLFEDKAARWKTQIDNALNSGSGNT